LLFDKYAIPIFVIAIPLATFIVGHIYVARLPRIASPRKGLPDMAAQWSIMARIGVAFMAASLVSAIGQLLVRTTIQRELGSESLGYLQASWAISMSYLGFILSAMGTDYYPRLTGSINDAPNARKIVNEQSEVCILLAAPVLLLMLAFSPWLMQILYSSEFQASVAIFRWQVLGDVLKIVSWPLGFVALAKGNGRAVLLSEIAVMLVFVAVTWTLVPIFGVSAAGIGYFCMYLAHLPIMYWLAIRQIDFDWAPRVRKDFFALFICAIAVAFLASRYHELSAIVGAILAAVWGIYSYSRLASAFGKDQVTLRKFAGLARVIDWIKSRWR
jgi:O-antigen/teichoic acid export membrane protein